jgi:hypothetical protein
MVDGYLTLQVRQRVRQIDCVTVKGSMRPMGLFTYDVTLERVATPDQGSIAVSQAAAMPIASRRNSLASSASNAPSSLQINADVVSHSLSTYNWEFAEHPDLACTWAVDEAFLELFAQV